MLIFQIIRNLLFSPFLSFVLWDGDIKSMDKNIRSDGNVCFMI